VPPSLFMLAVTLIAMTSRPRPAIDTILAAFADHRIVLLGEIHGSVAQHRFIQRLLRDPRLPATVTDIAVEFANSRYQPLIDRYVSGETVSADSLALAWRNAIVPLAWDAAVYPAFFRTVREVNRKLPAARRLRVVALDPPIIWDSTHSAEDIPRRWGYRDPAWFGILERDVLARGRKALVIAGALHVIRRDPVTSFEPAPLDRAGLGDALTQRYPGQVYVTYPVVGSGMLARDIGRVPAGTLVEVRGTSLGARSSHVLLPGNVTVFTMVNGKRVPRVLPEATYPPIERLIDALVYYGPDSATAVRVMTPYRDSTWVAELHRRSSVVQPIFGQDLDPVIDSLARAAAAHGGARAKR